jgi:hypothetical protein
MDGELNDAPNMHQTTVVGFSEARRIWYECSLALLIAWTYEFIDRINPSPTFLPPGEHVRFLVYLHSRFFSEFLRSMVEQIVWSFALAIPILLLFRMLRHFRVSVPMLLITGCLVGVFGGPSYLLYFYPGEFRQGLVSLLGARIELAIVAALVLAFIFKRRWIDSRLLIAVLVLHSIFWTMLNPGIF